MRTGPIIFKIGDIADNSRESFWHEIGLLPSFADKEGCKWASISQLARLRELFGADDTCAPYPQLPDDLFSAEKCIALNSSNFVVAHPSKLSSHESSVWLQLIPLWCEDAIDNVSLREWSQLELDGYKFYSLSPTIARMLNESRQRHKVISEGRGMIFSRSANYMGSKSSLAGQILDVLCVCWRGAGPVVDLMCGSGAVAGAVSNYFPAIASDAQSFSRFLARVQGGGMTRARASKLADRVTETARHLYSNLLVNCEGKIRAEDEALNAELSLSEEVELLRQMREEEAFWHLNGSFSEENVRLAWEKGLLISHLYGGVYFGHRQALELDCLRLAIDGIGDESDREWALGALMCAASSCAYTYGGHFAQPKFDAAKEDSARRQLGSVLKQRSMSVTHEFFVRLLSLAEESERIAHEVRLADGPWQLGLESASAMANGRSGCVYLDPPYTRDEYSRYYHVLEAISLYKPMAVHGKGRIAARGSAARYASAFGGRSKESAELEISQVIIESGRKGFDCLWSYSSSGVADIAVILNRVSSEFRSTEIFQCEHVYKAQGKAMSKTVTEYLIYLHVA